jgi:hypothetical protein
MARSGCPRREAVVPAPVYNFVRHISKAFYLGFVGGMTYHVHSAETQLDSCASGKTIIDTRADNHLVSFEQHPAKLLSS